MRFSWYVVLFIRRQLRKLRENCFWLYDECFYFPRCLVTYQTGPTIIVAQTEVPDLRPILGLKIILDRIFSLFHRTSPWTTHYRRNSGSRRVGIEKTHKMRGRVGIPTPNRVWPECQNKFSLNHTGAHSSATTQQTPPSPRVHPAE